MRVEGIYKQIFPNIGIKVVNNRHNNHMLMPRELVFAHTYTRQLNTRTKKNFNNFQQQQEGRIIKTHLLVIYHVFTF